MSNHDLSNLKPSTLDSRDYVAKLEPIANLPSSVDLKIEADEVENQYMISSCTANAGCSALELMYKKNGVEIDLSRMFLYFFERKLENTTGNVGVQPRTIGKALATYGACYEKTWPYNESLLDTEPNDTAKTEAEKYKIISYEQLGMATDKLTDIKTALAQNIPILLTIQVHMGFYGLANLTGDWKTHTWDWTTSDNNPLMGYHEVLIIGYDDASQHLLVENSWGPNWADGGFFGIPYSMINSEAFGELWIVKPNLGEQLSGISKFINDIRNTASKIAKLLRPKIAPIAIVLSIVILAIMFYFKK